MAETPEDPLAAAIAIAKAFDAHRVPYAIGGALAYGYWAVPRATLDIDVNVFVPRDGLAPVLAALDSLGIVVPAQRAQADSDARGMFTASFGEFRVDVFTPSIDFSWEAQRTRHKATVDGYDLWFLSAETIAVFKLLFFRVKDRADLQRLVAVRPGLDAAKVRRHLVEMMGAEDERVAFWDTLFDERD